MLSESMLGAHGSTGNSELRTTPPPPPLLLPPPGGYLKPPKKLSSLGSRNRFDGGFSRKEREEGEEAEGTAMAGIFHEGGCRQAVIMAGCQGNNRLPGWCLCLGRRRGRRGWWVFLLQSYRSQRYQEILAVGLSDFRVGNKGRPQGLGKGALSDCSGPPSYFSFRAPWSCWYSFRNWIAHRFDRRS
ncbi:hypothetical protein CRG98_028005 [Punica granatum]|uniref:Uncharacterized protein n=1 Tax=Punica granatum TaxID=22663 RepID=A0A2I0J5S1_PUNGR|nr:hypothetical protein CRG98_028005 [Punica granatum]